MFYFFCVFKRGDWGRRKAEISYRIQAFSKHVQLYPLKEKAPRRSSSFLCAKLSLCPPDMIGHMEKHVAYH